MEVSALTGENVDKLFLTIGELEISNRTKFSIGFVHLHQGYNAESFYDYFAECKIGV